MKKILYIFLFIILNSSLLIINSSAQWVQQLATDHPIRDIEFINRYTGWACGDSHIYKTTNGGVNWFEQANPANWLIEQVFPLDSIIAYAVGWKTILKTTNGGTNWLGIRTGGPGSNYATLEGAYFLNENTGWLCGSVTIMKTTDGCQTFDSARIEGDMHDIYFKDSLNGVMVGEGIIFKTTNGGTNWSEAQINYTFGQPFLYRVSFINDYTGWTAGNTNAVFKTTNFGSTWDSVGATDSLFSDVSTYCIEFADSLIGYAGGSFGKLVKTTDGGITWKDQVQPAQGYVRSIYTYSDSIVWLCGFKKILFSQTGGQTGITQIGSEIPKDFELSQNYPNPFNPVTNIKFRTAERGPVRLTVYDGLGREVEILVKEELTPGSYITQWNAGNFSSGIYYYRLETKNYNETKKMVLLK